jgi:mannose-6-phosphate isomerase-like protein (cupin superfamily)
MDEDVRPWGRYEILSESSDHKVKRIVVNAGALTLMIAISNPLEKETIVKIIVNLINKKNIG